MKEKKGSCSFYGDKEKYEKLSLFYKYEKSTSLSELINDFLNYLYLDEKNTIDDWWGYDKNK